MNPFDSGPIPFNSFLRGGIDDSGGFDASRGDCFSCDGIVNAKKEEAEAQLKSLTISTTAGLRIQVCSDLHLEFYGTYERIPSGIIVQKAPVLALLGDIGLAKTELLKRFLHFQAERFEHVIFLAGNHEYYNSSHTEYTVSEQFQWMQDVCNEKDNLHFMERDAIEINDVVILGTTLWSKIPKRLIPHAQQSMNDYYKSFRAVGENLSAEDTNYQHQISIQWLKDQIDKYKSVNKTVVVLTHHTPFMEGTSKPMYSGSELSCCFSTDLGKLLKSPVKYWSCGHTHHNFDLSFDDGNTRLVSNQKGYPGKRCMGFDSEGLILSIP